VTYLNSSDFFVIRGEIVKRKRWNKNEEHIPIRAEQAQCSWHPLKGTYNMSGGIHWKQRGHCHS
jgi:hypothetical protein